MLLSSERQELKYIYLGNIVNDLKLSARIRDRKQKIRGMAMKRRL